MTLSADADVFNCIAKLRAARRVWSSMTAACGATSGTQAMRLHVRTADRMMTKRDPWVNLLRVTAANFAAGVGGAASVTTASFDSQLGEPVELGDRLARNTQLLLQDESNIGRVIDPMGGSWFIESLTDEIATAAWALFQELESEGGLPGVLLDGSLADANRDCPGRSSGPGCTSGRTHHRSERVSRYPRSPRDPYCSGPGSGS